ncbi:Inositol phospholipid biosynthesis protein [Pleurostoma richardsiae]|uniref:Acyl-coenzyme A diphosphatase SCS3 n=1 Tax=Pleurostoma richardsiae TaxID=41990 RepID=A0AA38RCA4_9PEZI|nr:Inositol phospholipid biosynthesis protein [Pleurostoma richardsiae]
MDTPPAANTRSRTTKMTSPDASPSPSSPTTTAKSSSSTVSPARNPPFLPTPLEATFLAAYPALLAFGTLFSLLSPDVRAAGYDAAAQTHMHDPATAPSYFARKDNVFNTLFVKRGWAWVSAAFFGFLLTHPALAEPRRRAAAVARWALVTGWWVLVTQWCFGPAIIDRGFRITGGKCEVVENKLEEGEVDGVGEVFTAVACKASGGSWRGGHDISGHVFLLVLGSYFLLQEVGWVYVRWRGRRREERSVVMHDGAVKSAAVEGERIGPVAGGPTANHDGLGIGGRFAGAVIVLSWWMILMTAIYFHTWFEKLTGLLVAFSGLYVVYILPRFIPAVRKVVGLPGI